MIKLLVYIFHDTFHFQQIGFSIVNKGILRLRLHGRGFQSKRRGFQSKRPGGGGGGQEDEQQQQQQQQ